MRRLPAEWEPQSFVQLTFPHANSDWAPYLNIVTPCFVRIAEEIAKRQQVLIVCQDMAETRRLLVNANMANIKLVELPSNDTWARDHAAITVEDNGKPVLLDFIFNGWGLKFPANHDNRITQGLYNAGVFIGASLEKVGLALEGGSIESDGQGTILTTSECMLSPNRNPHLNQAQVEAELKRVLGAKHVLWLNHGYLAGDDTDSHIDTLARLCPNNTIAYVKCDDTTDEHYAALKQMEAELQALRTPAGDAYRLVALPFCDACYDEEGQRLPATYANYLYINGAILLPVYNVAQDQAAIAVMQQLFPSHQIVPIDCSSLIIQHGSLHCVTMQFPQAVSLNS